MLVVLATAVMGLDEAGCFSSASSIFFFLTTTTPDDVLLLLEFGEAGYAVAQLHFVKI